jgi:hypothetical protein
MERENTGGVIRPQFVEKIRATASEIVAIEVVTGQRQQRKELSGHVSTNQMRGAGTSVAFDATHGRRLTLSVWPDPLSL